MLFVRSHRFETFRFEYVEPAPGWERQFATGSFSAHPSGINRVLSRDLFQKFKKFKKNANITALTGLVGVPRKLYGDARFLRSGRGFGKAFY
jgi:hypothetical protein